MTQQQESPPGTSPEEQGGTAADVKGVPVDKVVFGVGASLAVVFVLWGILSTESLSSVSSGMISGLIKGGGWLFILAATGFVVFALWLAFSKFGRIKLGEEDEQPEFRTVSWIAMMFSAGMGIGLMFYGVAEPLSFFTSPPPGSVVGGDQVESLRTAMATSLFHWTLHPWAIYAVVGLAIAYSTFRKGRRQLISQAFIPLIGEKAANGTPGRVIDIIAIFATVFGSAASLGLGALQIGGGLDATGFLPDAGNEVLVPIIIVLTAAFILSAVSGVAKGIQWLSNINMVLAGVLALFVFVVGPTVIILDLLPTAVGAYFSEFFEMVGRTEATGGAPMLDWLSSWTVFYWAWWISWTPFVGMFLAKISRGRTIRQFVGGVILVPSLVSLLWFAIFGGTAITQQQAGLNPAGADTETQLFSVLQAYPLATVTGILVMVLVAIFFVSGADAASIVTGTLSQRGTDEPKKWVVIFWGATMGLVAMVMLLVGGEDALSGLQNLTILVAAPFVIIMIALCVALTRDLNHDPVVLREIKGTEVIEQAIDYGTDKHGDDFYLRVQSFPADADGPWRTTVNEAGERVTYADVRRNGDPFRESDEPVPADAPGRPDADGVDDTLQVGPTGGAERETAGRPSADRE
ncbi:BCCT family transporter [Actinomycetospora soli]|uniref:BCCT family transporter n=1 Tax=Actinomycetospora soli TaxID=2893887 RepID=UPI003556CA6D